MYYIYVVGVIVVGLPVSYFFMYIGAIILHKLGLSVKGGYFNG